MKMDEGGETTSEIKKANMVDKYEAILDLELTIAKLLKILAMSILLGVVAILLTFFAFPEKLYDVSMILSVLWLFVVGINCGLFLASEILRKKEVKENENN